MKPLRARHVNVSRDESERLERETLLAEQHVASMRAAARNVWSQRPAWVAEVENNDRPVDDSGTRVEADEGFDMQHWENRRSRQSDLVNARLDAQSMRQIAEFERRAEEEVSSMARQIEEASMREADNEARIQAGCTEAEWKQKKKLAAQAARQAARRQPWEWHGLEAFLQSLGLEKYGYAPKLRRFKIDSPEALAALNPFRLRQLGMDHKHAQRLRMGVAELRAFDVKTAQQAECPSSVSVTGAEATLQWDLMGVFTKFDAACPPAHDGRSTYRNANGKYLYYWKESSEWCLGASYESGDCGACSASMEMCPIRASDWLFWDGNDWSSACTITIKEFRNPKVPDASQAAAWLSRDVSQPPRARQMSAALSDAGQLRQADRLAGPLRASRHQKPSSSASIARTFRVAATAMIRPQHV